MSTRLDRLLLLLDTGSTALIRRNAAEQLGEVQRLHPHELNNLLNKVHTYLCSVQWETRIAAGLAVESIIKQVPQWSPKGRANDSTGEKGEGVGGGRLRLSAFSISRLLDSGAALLGSQGSEYDVQNIVGPNDREQLMLQKKLLCKRLGLDQMMGGRGGGGEELIDENDLINEVQPETSVNVKHEDILESWRTVKRSDENGAAVRETKRRQSAARESVQSAADVGSLAETNKRNIERRPSDGEVAAKIRKISSGTSIIGGGGASSGGSGASSEAATASSSADRTAVDSMHDNTFNTFNIDEIEEWPFEWFAEVLMGDLFHSSWERRHGAAIGLRHLIKIHGSGAGRTLNTRTDQMSKVNGDWLEDVVVRLTCILALDRFGDYIGDEVVAPVREQVGQTLGVTVLYLDASRTQSLVEVLIRLTEQPQWEVKHGGLLGLKYLIAVKQEMMDWILSAVLPCIHRGLKDQSDDVRSVAAATLLPVSSKLIDQLPEKAGVIVRELWEILNDLDDLTASTNNIMSLLSDLLTQNHQLCRVEDLSVLVPRLWPFLCHSITSVRKASVNTLTALINISSIQQQQQQLSRSDKQQKEEADWLMNVLLPTLRHVYQRSLVETQRDVLSDVAKLWTNLVHSVTPITLVGLVAPYLGVWMCMSMQPVGVAYEPSYLIDTPHPHHAPSSGIGVTIEFIGGGGAADLPELSRETLVVANRLSAIRCLGVLCARLVQSSTPASDPTSNADVGDVLNTSRVNGSHSDQSATSKPHVEAVDSSCEAVGKRECSIAAVGVSSDCPTAAATAATPAAGMSHEASSITSSTAATAADMNHYSSSSSNRTVEDSLVDVFLFYLGSRSAVQRMCAALVIQEMSACKLQSTQWLERVKERLVTCLTDVVIYDELASSFTRLQTEGRELINRASYVIPQHPAISNLGSVLSLDQARRLCTELSDVTLNSSPSIRQDLRDSCIEQRTALLSIVNNTSSQLDLLNNRVRSSMSCALVSLGCLAGSGFSPIVRPLMISLRTERNQQLMELAAVQLSELIEMIRERDQSPVSKIISNLCALLCADPKYTPVIGQEHLYATPSDDGSLDGGTCDKYNGILSLLTVVQRNKMYTTNRPRRGRKPGVTGGGGAAEELKGDSSYTSTASPAAASAASAASAGSQAVSSAEPLSTADQQNQLILQRIGATLALTSITKRFSSNLPSHVPHLWQATIGRLHQPINTQNNTESSCAELIQSMQVLISISHCIDPALYPHCDRCIDTLCSALDHEYTSVRHMIGNCLAVLASLRTQYVVNKLSEIIIPALNASRNDRLREGSIEALLLIVERLGIELVPHISLLVVPVLGCMTDQQHIIRLTASCLFASLIRLLPLSDRSDGSTSKAAVVNHSAAGAADSCKEESAAVSHSAAAVNHSAAGKADSSKAESADSAAGTADSCKEESAVSSSSPPPMGGEERRFVEQLLDGRTADGYIIPVPVNAQLRKYQQDGVNWLGFLCRYKLHGILCDDMGLGKTLQSLCVLAGDHYNRHINYEKTGGEDCSPLPSIVVCPPTLTGHWFYEVGRYISTQHLNPLHYVGNPTDRARLQKLVSKHNLIIASYDVVRNDIEFFSKIKWNYCILDEGHIIKNSKTKISRSVKQLCSNHRLILSGTPIQNNVLELWSLFDFLMPGFLGTERQFQALYGRPILQSRDAKSTTREQEAGALALESLHRQVLPFMLRRLKEDVLDDLPPKIMQDYYCDLSPVQRMLYEHIKSSQAQQLLSSAGEASEENENTENKTHVFQALQYLRKVCDHPALVLNNKHPLHANISSYLTDNNTTLRDINNAPKLTALRQLLLDCGVGIDGGDSVVGQHRVLLFCQLKSMLDIIEKDLFKVHMPSVTYLRLDGSVPAAQRFNIVTRFNNDPSIDVLLLTTHVGGLGLNLTGADTVIFYEHDWNPMKDLQAMDRAHRIGQRKVVNVYRLITRGTIEEKIMGLQKFKVTIAESVVNEDNSGLSSMDTCSVLDLFSLDEGGGSVGDGGRDDTPLSMKAVLDNLGEVWDSQQYSEEYNMDNFLQKLK